MSYSYDAACQMVIDALEAVNDTNNPATANPTYYLDLVRCADQIHVIPSVCDYVLGQLVDAEDMPTIKYVLFERRKTHGMPPQGVVS